jgi:hypothetical protein
LPIPGLEEEEGDGDEKPEPSDTSKGANESNDEVSDYNKSKSLT